MQPSSITQEKIDALREAVRALMTPDTHIGEPHRDTVDAITHGVIARVKVSQSRPAAYAGDPWRGQSSAHHLAHARDHANTARNAAYHDSPARWLSDLGQPEAAHAGLRIDFALWRYAEGA